MTFCLLPFFEKPAHITGQVLDHRHISQWLDGNVPILHDLVDMSTAGPARNPVDHHRAGAAHAYPTGKAITQGGIEFALNPGNHIEDRLAGLLRDLKILQFSTVGVTAPNADGKGL